MSEQQVIVKSYLYSIPQIAIATFFGTVLAGLICLAHNYRATGQGKQFNNVIKSILIVVPAVVYLYATIPDSSYDRLWPVGMAVIMYFVANKLQGSMIKVETNNNARLFSYWRVFAVVVTSLFVLLALLVPVMMIFDF